MKATVFASPRVFWLVLWVGLGLLHLATLLRIPSPFVDEAWNANRAWQYIHTGIPFGTFDFDGMASYPGYEHLLPWLPALIQGLAQQLAGHPSLLAVRLVSLFFGFALLTAIYQVTTRLVTAQTAKISVLLTAVSLPFFYSAHMARPDIWITALAYTSLALILTQGKLSLAAHILAGFLLGVAVEIHPFSLIFVPALLTAKLILDGWRTLHQPNFWAIGFGLSAGAVFYISLHILPAPSTYFTINRVIFGETHTAPLLQGLDAWLGSFTYQVSQFSLTLPLHTPLYIIAVGLALWQRSRAQLMLLAWSAICLLFQASLIRSYSTYYLILLTPALDILLASLLLKLPWRKGKYAWLKFSGSVFLIAWLVSSYLITTPFLLRNDLQTLNHNLARLSPYIHPGDTLMGSQHYWFGLADHKFDSWEEVHYYQRWMPGSSLEDAFLYYRPDLYLMDAHMESFIRDQPGDSHLKRVLWIPKTELLSILQEYGELATEFEGGAYGHIRLYRLQWPPVTP